MRYTVTKIEDNGTVAIRHYSCKECIKSGEDLNIHYKDQIMTLKAEEIESSVKKISSIFKSEYKDGKDYKLWFFTWNPKTEEI
jgi:hypothetical protein